MSSIRARLNVAIENVEHLQHLATSQVILRSLSRDIGLDKGDKRIQRISEQSLLAARAYVGRKLTEGQINETHKNSTGYCCWCGCPTRRGGARGNKATVEHIWPEFLGGESRQANLVIACDNCNPSRQHAFNWAWFATQAVNEKMDANGALPRQITISLGLHRLLSAARGQTRLISRPCTLKEAMKILKVCNPSVKGLLQFGRRYTYFELLELTKER